MHDPQRLPFDYRPILGDAIALAGLGLGLICGALALWAVL